MKKRTEKYEPEKLVLVIDKRYAELIRRTARDLDVSRSVLVEMMIQCLLQEETADELYV